MNTISAVMSQSDVLKREVRGDASIDIVARSGASCTTTKGESEF
jgi:hypothetical protein